MGGWGLTGILLGLLLLVLHFMQDRRLQKKISSLEYLQDLRNEIDGMIRELNQTTDRNVGIAEEKLKHLNRAVKEADKRITLLEQKTPVLQNPVQQTYEHLKQQKQYERVETEQDKRPSPQGKDKSSRVINMHHQGFDASIIANRLSMPIGEVELIISLKGADR